jgi:large-conductance mechanosensitive channel
MIAILIFLLVAYCIYLVVDAWQMSTKDREKLGLGPLGQGRDK